MIFIHKVGTKLNKTLYASAERKRQGSTEYFRYSEFSMLEDFRRALFIDAMARGDVLVDFDARLDTTTVRSSGCDRIHIGNCTPLFSLSRDLKRIS